MAMASMPPACAATELVAKGRESAAVLKAMLGQLPAAATPHDGLRDLAEQVLRCCDRALAALLRGAATEEAACSSWARKRRKQPAERQGGLAPPPPSPAATGSKRMRMSRGERGTRAEKKETMEDGFIWRKYGQKDIHGSNYPRLYFRCTYKDDRGCEARRQVQRSDTDPCAAYLITYFGEHTCCCRDDAVEAPAPFVIDFGLSAAACDDGLQLPQYGSPWPSCDDDGPGPVELQTPPPRTSADLCSSPPEEELRAGACDVAEFVAEQSTTVTAELMGRMTSPEWDGCLDWELGEGDSSLDVDGFDRYYFDYSDLL